MIKIIAFDLVGVLVREKDLDMSYEEEKLERLFGPNKSDSEYITDALKIIPNEEQIISSTKKILENLYEVREEDLLTKLKQKYPNIKIAVATNHVTYIKKFIVQNFGEYLDDIIISAEIDEIKPSAEFYNKLCDILKCKKGEILFLDDNANNIEGAKACGLNTIKVDKETKLFEEINKFLELKL